MVVCLRCLMFQLAASSTPPCYRHRFSFGESIPAVRGEETRADEDCLRGDAGVAEEQQTRGKSAVAVPCGGPGASTPGTRSATADGDRGDSEFAAVPGKSAQQSAHSPDGAEGIPRSPTLSSVRSNGFRSVVLS